MNTSRSSSWLKKLFSAPVTAEPDLQVPGDQEGPEAQTNLGLLHACCEEFDGDAATGAQCFRGAAEHGYALAQYNLALLYEQGRGVRVDANLAREWLTKAALQGDGAAQCHLGIYYHRQSLLPGNLNASECKIEALKWFRLASAQQYGRAETLCSALLLTMTDVQLAESDRRAAAFTPLRGHLTVAGEVQ